jgi:thiamine monophosphate synthase
MRAIESSSRERSLEARRLNLITGARPDLTVFLEAAIRGGVDLVQVREKVLDDRDRLALISEARWVST